MECFSFVKNYGIAGDGAPTGRPPPHTYLWSVAWEQPSILCLPASGGFPAFIKTTLSRLIVRSYIPSLAYQREKKRGLRRKKVSLVSLQQELIFKSPEC